MKTKRRKAVHSLSTKIGTRENKSNNKNKQTKENYSHVAPRNSSINPLTPTDDKHIPYSYNIHTSQTGNENIQTYQVGNVILI